MTWSSSVDWETTKKSRQSSCFLGATTALTLTLVSWLVMIPRACSLVIMARRISRRVDVWRVPTPSFYPYRGDSSYSSFHPRPLSSTRGRNSFDSLEDESQGFGAFDYVPDEYDWQDMNTGNNLDPDGYDFVSGQDEYESSNVNVGSGWEEPNTGAWNQRKRQGPWNKTPPGTKNSDSKKRESQTTPPELEPTSHQPPEQAPTTAAAATNLTNTTAAPTSTPETDSRQSRASKGIAMSTELDAMEEQLERILQKINIEASNHNYPNLNPNSPRQVSEALFGIEGESTGKEVLEALASSKSNKKHLADLILHFRQLARDIGKRKKRQENKEKGTLAKSVHTVKRSIQTTTTTSPLTTASTPSAEENDTEETISPKQTDPKAPPTSTPEDPLLLVDASAIIYRAYYAFPPLHRADGMPIGAVLGFCNMLNKLVLNNMMEGKQPRIVLVFDAPGKTFRHAIYTLYKANRSEAPVDLIPQFGLIRQVAKAYGIAQIEVPTFEADDVIATLARMALEEGVDCNILSADKDLMQLITPTEIVPSVQMIDPMTMSRVTHEDVVEKWGVPADKLGDILALAGDASDNVPGVPGIGPKIAAELIDTFGTLDNLLDNLEAVKQNGRREKLKANVDQARLSRVLVELDRNIPFDRMKFPDGIEKVSDLRMELMDVNGLSQFFGEMGLRDLKMKFDKRVQLQRGETVAPQQRQDRSKFASRPRAEVPKPEDFQDVPF